MEFTSFEAIMDFAIEKEKEAAGFYDDLGAQEAFAGARKTFADFAAEERRHRDMLEHFTTDNIERYKIQKIPNLKRSDYLVDLAYEPGMSYSDILILATKREEKALKFYSDFSEKATVAEHKKLFQILAQEEAKHKLTLETMLDDYMAPMGD